MSFKKASNIDSIKERLIAFLLNIYDAVFLSKAKPVANGEKWLLVVKIDLLGDYVLIRNFIEKLKVNSKYRDHKIAFCCNAGVFEISKSLDNDFIDSWIPIKLKPFQKDFAYRKQVVSELRKRAYEVAILPTQSRSFFHDDQIAKLVVAKNKVAAKGNGYNMLKWQYAKSPSFYDQIIDCSWSYDFEFSLSKRFFERLCSNLYVEFPSIKVQRDDSRKRVLISPGASAEFRRWSTSNFAVVINHMLEKEPELEVVISGAPNEKYICDEINDQFADNKRVINLCGKLKLSELVGELAKCQLLIANESGVTHLAKAVKVPFIYCISNGNHYKRFNPYPIDGSGVAMNYFYPPEFVKELERDKEAAVEKYYWGSRIDIENISTQTLVNAFDKDRLSIFST
ncbi:MAG: glycosyltransferase family 9 protein [Bacteroidia bacterium]